MPYISATSHPDLIDRLSVVDPFTGVSFPYVKSVDTDLGIIEEVLFDGVMSNGRLRPRLMWGRVMTKTRFAIFDVVNRDTGEVLYRCRRR